MEISQNFVAISKYMNFIDQFQKFTVNFWTWSSKVIFKIQSSKKICRFLNLIFKSDLQNTIFKKICRFLNLIFKSDLQNTIFKKICKFFNLIFKSDLQNTILIFWRSLLMITFKVYSFLAPFLQFFSSIFTVFCCILESSEN